MNFFDADRLAGKDRAEVNLFAPRIPLRFQTNMTEVGKHAWGHMPDGHDGLITSLRLGKLSDCFLGKKQKELVVASEAPLNSELIKSIKQIV